MNELSAQDALVAVMVASSVSNENIATAELVTIERIVNHFPIFARYDPARIGTMASLVYELFEQEDGIDALLGLVRSALPGELVETAYVMALDVVAADGSADETELRFLEELRHELDIDRLHAAAMERAARARHRTIP